MKLKPSLLFAAIAAALGFKAHSSKASDQIIPAKETPHFSQHEQFRRSLPKTVYPQPKWPFNGKNRSQRQRLSAGFFAMS